MLNNKKLKNNNIVIMNFTGVYENQEFYQDLGAVWLELGDIQGTNCYCDEEAEAALWNPPESTSWIPEITIM